MSAVEVWPPDSELRTRRVITATHARREKKRSRRYLRVSWPLLVKLMDLLGTDRATRLMLVLLLQSRLTRAGNEWVDLRSELLRSVGVNGPHLSHVVARLEATGRVEVERRRGKKPRLRLIQPENAP